MRLHFLLFLLGDPAFVAFVYANKCFADKSELKAAVDQYVDEEDCANNDGCAVGQMYGWPIGTWCVGNVTDTSELFMGSSFNGDISKWNVSSVTDMGRMFDGSGFNSDISEWSVSSVTNTRYMFAYSAFNGDISKWEVSSVTYMTWMFQESIFNGDISNWDVSSVTSMGNMFGYSAFNSDISKWNVSSVTDTGWMFYDNKAFNGDLSKYHQLPGWGECSKVAPSTAILASGMYHPLPAWGICLLTTRHSTKIYVPGVISFPTIMPRISSPIRAARFNTLRSWISEVLFVLQPARIRM